VPPRPRGLKGCLDAGLGIELRGIELVDLALHGLLRFAMEL
jgi:hypothetical protein